MTKDFSNPKKLGFIRFIQVLFAFNVCITLLGLVFVSKSNYTLDFTNILDLINLIFDAVSFWLIYRRTKAARYFIMAFSLFNIVIGTIAVIANGQFSLVERLSTCSSDIFLFLYFLTSRRVKVQLNRPFSTELNKEHLDKHVEFYQPKKWFFWRDIIIYFCVFSVVGHWMEAGYCTLIRYGILPGIYDPTSQIWHDWLYPFPVYGFGMVACILLFFPIKNYLQRKFNGNIVPLILSFLVNAFVCTLIEFCMGMILNQPLPDGSLPLWDYRNMFCNFMGQVCLQNAVGFGLAATIMTWVLYPLMERFLRMPSQDVMNGVFIAVVVGFAILFFFYCVNVVIPGSDSTPEGQLDLTSQASYRSTDTLRM